MAALKTSDDEDYKDRSGALRPSRFCLLQLFLEE